MFFVDSPVASSLFLAMCSITVDRSDELSSALAEAIIFVGYDRLANAVDKNDLSSFLYERQRGRTGGGGKKTRQLPRTNAGINSFLIDLRAYAQLRNLVALEQKISDVLRISNGTHGHYSGLPVLILNHD